MVTTDLYRLASRFLGMREVSGSVHNPQILAMLRLDQAWPAGDEVPWCSGFVNYIAWLLNLPRSKSLAARSWLNVGEAVELVNAVRGCDVVVFSRGSDPAAGHVAIFDRLDGLGVYVLGGNQGDAVNVERFPISQVIGVRRLVADTSADAGERILSGRVGE
jgi:uncharacterized protein (TIGR02594 family)